MNKSNINNCDRFATAADALSEYRQMCKETCCGECPFEDGGIDYAGCCINWLYAEVEKEASK